MMKPWILIGCLFLTTPIYAQDVPDTAPIISGKEKQEPAMELKEIVKGVEPLSKRIFFVIDVSGSMIGDGKIKKAIRFVRNIWQTPVDEFEIAVVVFNDKATRWEGIACNKDDAKPCPKGWAKMPSKDAIDSAQTFLNHYPGDGNTHPLTALEIALNEDRSDLSIVFVTDGDYSGNTQEVLDKIKEMQETREKKDLGKALICVFGVGDAEKQKNLHAIGKDYHGGFYMEKKVEEKAETPTPSPDPNPAPTPDPTPPPNPTPDSPFYDFPHRHKLHRSR